jgi:hypothetical protein
MLQDNLYHQLGTVNARINILALVFRLHDNFMKFASPTLFLSSLPVFYYRIAALFKLLV